MDVQCTMVESPLVEFIYLYLVFTRMPGENYRKRLGSFLLCLCYVFGALINSVCVCVCACVRARVRACVRVCVCVRGRA